MRAVIEKRLKEKGLTWYGLTKLLNVVPIVVYRLRERNSCSIGMLHRLADALEMSIADFPLEQIHGLRWTATTEEGRHAQRQARLKGWSDMELARQVGVNNRTIERFFRGIATAKTRQWVMEALTRHG